MEVEGRVVKDACGVETEVKVSYETRRNVKICTDVVRGDCS